MIRIRQILDAVFERYGHLLVRRRWAVLGTAVLLLGALLSQLPRLATDTSNEGFLHPDDPILLDYTRFREQFGRESMLIVAVTPPEVFNAAFFERLRALHEALDRDVSYLKEVTSLVNVRDTRGDADRLIVEELLKEIPESAQELATFRKRVLASKLFPDYLISEDGSTTAILLETLAYSPAPEGESLAEGFSDTEAPLSITPDAVRTPLTPQENAEVVEATRQVLARFDAPDFRLSLSGGPVVDDFFREAIPREVGQFLGLAILAIGVFLLLLFRRLVGVVLPLGVFVLSLACTLALMALFDTPVKLPTTILPAFLLAVGVGSSVHLLTVFFLRLQHTGSKPRAIAETLGHSGLPILMTGVTTAAGLFSFTVSEVAPVAELGLFGGLGTLLALGMTLVLGPALLAVWPVKSLPRATTPSGTSLSDRFLLAVADFATSRSRGIVIVCGALAVVAGIGLTRVDFSHNPITWIPAASPVRKDFDHIEHEMKGAGTLEVILDSGRENGLYEPGLLRKAEELVKFAEAYRLSDGRAVVGKSTSVLNVLKETHQALNENRASAYAIPADRKLIAQELLLFENSGNDDLEKLVDSRFSRARLTFRLRNDDASAYAGFIAAVTRKARELFGDRASVTATGGLMLYVHTMHGMMQSMALSYLVAGTVITVLMAILIGSLRLGLLSMIPNLLPIAVTMGVVMGWFRIPMDAFTMLLGSVALGLAVDDTIHFFHHFRRYYAATGDVREAVRQSFLTAGRAMLFTTLVLVTGFWLFMLASLNNVFNVGLLTGIALLLALLADLLLSPALVCLILRVGGGAAARPEQRAA